ncbi:MAG: uracil-DNA glycosylase family protein [Sphingomonas sp.]
METLAEDAPRDWLARPAPRESAAPAPASAPVEALPDTLEAFVAWRLGDAAPEAGWLTPRIGPSGPADAELMILTDMPEAEDGATLLEGAPGRLLDAMLAAIGESRESAYVASLAVARPLTGQIPADDEPRLAALARHHVALVAPQRLLLLGQAANRVYPTTSGSAQGNTGCDINHSVRNMEAVAIDHPRFLLRRPAGKAEVWKQLLRLRRGTSE